MRCAIYGRVSTGRQEVTNQLEQLREFAARQDWLVIEEYIDEASGGLSDRVRFKDLFRDASQRRFDVLLFWSLDRLSREGVYETLQHLQRLTQYGVGYRSFVEPYLDSCGLFKDAVVSILATIAKQERIRLSERTRAGLSRARRAGKILGRPRVVSPETLNRIQQLRASGQSWTAIVRETGVARATAQRAVRQA